MQAANQSGTVQVIRFVTGFWVTYPNLVEGCEFDLTLAESLMTHRAGGWNAMLEQWDMTEAESQALIKAGMYRIGIVDNQYIAKTTDTTPAISLTDAERDTLIQRYSELSAWKYTFKERVDGTKRSHEQEMLEIIELITEDDKARGV